jgi:hypothetical protein
LFDPQADIATASARGPGLCISSVRLSARETLSRFRKRHTSPRGKIDVHRAPNQRTSR